MFKELNPNLEKGGDRKSENRKPLALRTKKQAEGLEMQISPPNSPGRVAAEYHESEPASPVSFFVPDNENIDPFNQELEDPLDYPDGLEDPLDEELAYQNSVENGEDDDNDDDNNGDIDGNSADGNDGDYGNAPGVGDVHNVGDTMDTEEIQNYGTSRESMEENESIVLNMADSSFLKGRILLLNVEDGDCEAPCCCLCHQIAMDGEDLTFLLENKLRNLLVFTLN